MLKFGKNPERELQKRLLEQGLTEREARSESRLLLCFVTGKTPAALLAYGADLSQTQEETLSALLVEREKGVPLAYLLGETEFFGRRFAVGPGVLIPRQDTECLVAEALAYLADKKEASVLDLCAGSGCVGLTLAARRPDCRVSLLEKEEKAFSYLEQNQKALGVSAALILGDLFTHPLPGEGSLDLITANPPYIAQGVLPELQREVSFEPRSALDGGADGLLFYRAIAERWSPCLKTGGLLAVEIGYDQKDAVSACFESAGLTGVCCRQDLSGNDRVILGYQS